MRRLLRINLEDRYEIVDTGKPEEALALAMQAKPSAILLDLEECRITPAWSFVERSIHGLHSIDSADSSSVQGRRKYKICCAGSSAPRRISRSAVDF